VEHPRTGQSLDVLVDSRVSSAKFAAFRSSRGVEGLVTSKDDSALAARALACRGVWWAAVHWRPDQAVGARTRGSSSRCMGRLWRPMSGRLSILQGTRRGDLLSDHVAVPRRRGWLVLRAARRGEGRPGHRRAAWDALRIGRDRLLLPRANDLLPRRPAMLHQRRCRQLLPLTTRLLATWYCVDLAGPSHQ
jgi:hypothetical protein